MHGEHTKPVIPDPKGYESEDLVLSPIIKWVTFLLLFVGISSLATWYIYLFLLPKANTVGATNRFSLERRLPPEPRVQALPKTEMKDFRLDEKQKIENAGWVDRQKGVVRIPIEQAMEMVIEKGAEGFKVEKGAEPITETPKTDELVKPIENTPPIEAPKPTEAQPSESKQ
jgi:hypothetical protein